ncbi:hypothetical protein AHF37_04972 [Paragonimus kellicotti]|nr:hypothetical protein AHF37_04972 [Paragonimus kellicotti]
MVLSSLNRLQKLPDSLSRLRSLVLLDVANNQLASLGDHLADLTSLEKLELCLGDNRIASISLSVFQGCSLTTLDLAHNGLCHLPEGLSVVLPNLVRLDVSANELNSAPNTVSQSIASESACTTAVEPVAAPHDNVPLKSTKNGQETTPLITTSQPNLDCGDNPVVRKEFQVPLANPAGVLNWSEPARGTPTSSLPALDDESEWLQASGASSTVQIRSVMLEQRMLKTFPRGLPTELGIMRSLQALMVERNPLRSIRQNVLAAGTNAIKEVLAQRHVPAASAPNTVSQSIASESACTTAVEPVAAPHDNVPLKSTKNGQETTPLITTSQPNLDCGDNPVVRKEFQVPLANPAGVLNWSEPARGTPTSSLPALDDESEWLQASGASSTVQIRSVMLEQRMLKTFPRGLASGLEQVTDGLDTVTVSLRKPPIVPSGVVVDRVHRLP